MGESLYGDPDLCIRELLQNALELRELRLKMKAVLPLVISTWSLGFPCAARLWGTDEETGQQWLCVTDNGVAMTRGGDQELLHTGRQELLPQPGVQPGTSRENHVVVLTTVIVIAQNAVKLTRSLVGCGVCEITIPSTGNLNLSDTEVYPMPKVFLSHSFDTDQPKSRGRTDFEVAQWFTQKIEEFGEGRIQVVTAQQPKAGPISLRISEAIDTCDALFCLFTRKHQQKGSKRWLPSQYVLSESGFAAARYYNRHPDKRVYAFVEEGIDRGDLGIAFSSDDQLPEFSRTDLSACEDDLRSFVTSIFKDQEDVDATGDFDIEQTHIHKKVLVRRDGYVVVTSRHFFRVINPDYFNQNDLGHYIWRVRDPLPTWQAMVDSSPNPRATEPFLNCRLISWEGANQESSEPTMKLTNFRPSDGDKELGFDVEFQGLEFTPLTRLVYEITWGYPDAFIQTTSDQNGDVRLPLIYQYNSVGTRAGLNGAIGEVILEISFERNWNNGESFPIFESEPEIFRAPAPYGPTDVSALRFWSDPRYWGRARKMLPVPHDGTTNSLYETYRVKYSAFQGQVKANWIAHPTYHPEISPDGVAAIVTANEEASKL